MTEETPKWLPIFPLQLVLLPEELIPLHIFEARYQAMVKRCQEDGIPFGIVLLQDGNLSPVGCSARVESVVKHYTDGRSDILIQGEARFACDSFRDHADGYLEGEVDLLPDLDEASDGQASDALLQLFQNLLQMRGEELDNPEGSEDDDPTYPKEATPGYTFKIAAAAGLPAPERQELLQMRVEADREALLVRHLIRILPKVRQQQDNELRVRTNGNVRGRPHE